MSAPVTSERRRPPLAAQGVVAGGEDGLQRMPGQRLFLLGQGAALGVGLARA